MILLSLEVEIAILWPPDEHHAISYGGFLSDIEYLFSRFLIKKSRIANYLFQDTFD